MGGQAKQEQYEAMSSSMDSYAWLEALGFKLGSDPCVPSKYCDEASDYMMAVYGIRPPAVPVYFVESGLGLFGGACFLEHEGRSAVVLRACFRVREKWFRYRRRDLLAHELCHAGRADFNSRKYEEVIAYQCASNRFSRYWGGVFHRHWEAYAVVIPAVLYSVASIFESFALDTLFWRFIPLALFLCLTVSYVVRHLRVMHQFGRAMIAAGEMAPVGMSVIYQSDDAKIDRLARFGPELTAAK
jgi:hypothetical protein